MQKKKSVLAVCGGCGVWVVWWGVCGGWVWVVWGGVGGVWVWVWGGGGSSGRHGTMVEKMLVNMRSK